MSLVSATAASGSRAKSSTASEVAAYTARLQLLQVALHQSAKAVTSCSNAAAKTDGQSSRGVKAVCSTALPNVGHQGVLLIACIVGECPDGMAWFRTEQTSSCLDFMHCEPA